VPIFSFIEAGQARATAMVNGQLSAAVSAIKEKGAQRSTSYQARRGIIWLNRSSSWSRQPTKTNSYPKAPPQRAAQMKFDGAMVPDRLMR
jgi:hypothetical protein